MTRIHVTLAVRSVDLNAKLETFELSSNIKLCQEISKISIHVVFYHTKYIICVSNSKSFGV